MTEQEFLDFVATKGYQKTGQSEYAVDMNNEERPHDSLGDRTPAEARQDARSSTIELSP